jgi:hypothetical protein
MTVRIEGKERYKWTNGHYPRGNGLWLFKIGTEEKAFRGTYSEASKKAIQYTKKNHPRIYSITVMP